MEIMLKFYNEQFKIVFPNTHEDLLKEISKRYHIPKNELDQLQLQYQDSDKDTILILSNEDLSELRKQVEKKEVNEIQIELNEKSKMFISQFHNKDNFVQIANEPSMLKEKCCSCLLSMKSNEGVNCAKCGFLLCDKCKVDFFHQHPLTERGGNKIEKAKEEGNDEGYFYNLVNLFKKIPSKMESMWTKSIGNDPYDELMKKARALYDLGNVSNDKLRYALVETNGSIEEAVILLTQTYY